VVRTQLAAHDEAIMVGIQRAELGRLPRLLPLRMFGVLRHAGFTRGAAGIEFGAADAAILVGVEALHAAVVAAVFAAFHGAVVCAPGLCAVGDSNALRVEGSGRRQQEQGGGEQTGLHLGSPSARRHAARGPVNAGPLFRLTAQAERFSKPHSNSAAAGLE
jgi:hypothetical protein